jgi:hypothetical protein
LGTGSPPDQTPGSATFSGSGNLTPNPATSETPNPLTSAQKLAKALKACQKKPRHKRASCIARAHKLYGSRRAPRRPNRPSHRGAR